MLPGLRALVFILSANQGCPPLHDIAYLPPPAAVRRAVDWYNHEIAWRDKHIAALRYEWWDETRQLRWERDQWERMKTATDPQRSNRYRREALWDLKAALGDDYYLLWQLDNWNRIEDFK